MASLAAALRLHLARPLTSSLLPSSLPKSFLFSSSPLPLPPLALPSRLFCCVSSSSSSTSATVPPPPLPLLTHIAHDLQDDEEEHDSLSDPEELRGDEEESEPELRTLEEAGPVQAKLTPPKLSIKEKKELAAYAHSLGKKLKSQQVGKSGVTPSVAASFVETLEANELLKLKIHGSCPGELTKVITQLEESTGSVAVGHIGRTVILYRPSLSKMQKKEAQGARKRWNTKLTEPASTFRLQKKRPGPRVSNHENHQNRHT